MLESTVNLLSHRIRSVAVKVASKANCIVTSTLDVRLNYYPIFSESDEEGLFRDVMLLTRSSAKDYMHGMRVVEFVAETDPLAIIGATASGLPRLLIVPATTTVHIPSNGENSSGFISCVGIYALHLRQRGVSYRGSFTRSPYTER